MRDDSLCVNVGDSVCAEGYASIDGLDVRGKSRDGLVGVWVGRAGRGDGA